MLVALRVRCRVVSHIACGGGLVGVELREVWATSPHAPRAALNLALDPRAAAELPLGAELFLDLSAVHPTLTWPEITA